MKFFFPPCVCYKHKFVSLRFSRNEHFFKSEILSEEELYSEFYADNVLWPPEWHVSEDGSSSEYSSGSDDVNIRPTNGEKNPSDWFWYETSTWNSPCWRRCVWCVRCNCIFFFFFFVGCARSWQSYAWALSSCGRWGLLSGRGGWASQCRGFSCCGAQAIDSWDMSLDKLQEMVKDREACLLQSRGLQRVRHDRATEQQQIVEQRLKSCVHEPRGIFPHLGWNPCPLNSHTDSSPLNHQGSPGVNYWTRKEKKKVKSFSRVWLFATSRTVGWSRLLHPWEFPGKSTGVGCHSLLQLLNVLTHKVLVK